MKTILVYQCEYCEKRTFKSKYACRKHEEICFFNKVTHSCATCIMFSCVHTKDIPYRCLIGEIHTIIEGGKEKFKTNCKKWMDYDLIDDLNLYESHEGMLNLLFIDSLKFYNSLKALIRKHKIGI